jgi:hypothetical protein
VDIRARCDNEKFRRGEKFMLPAGAVAHAIGDGLADERQ